MAIGNSSKDENMMSEINVTPLVDVMLVLLVVFIITAPLLAPQSLKINLPKVDAVPQNDKLQRHILAVNALGQIELDQAAVSDESLASVLRQQAGSPSYRLEIDADTTVPYGRIAELMAIAQRSGVLKLSFLTIHR